jgi:DNA polymerase-3 subunit beta
MLNVCIDVKDTHVNIVATDAHCLYKSENMPIVGNLPAGQYLVNGKALQGLKTAKKAKDVTIYIGNGNFKIEGITGALCGEKYPEYEAVIPTQFLGKVEATKKQFSTNLKLCSLYANKVTRQVVMHMNGAIAMSSQDIDYSLQHEIKFDYLSKTGEDITIGFNATLLGNILKQIKSDTFTFDYSTATRAGIFKGQSEGMFLLMPLHLGY